MPLRIAVIGAGHLGRIHAKLLGQVDDAELVGIVDPFAPAREAAAAAFNVPTYASYHELLAQIDAAIIASPSDLHAQTAADLLKANKHVFVEKPLTVCPAEADRLVQLAHARRCTLQVGHVERFNPAWTAAAEVTAHAKYVEAVRASRFPGRCLDVGVVMDLMIHDIDLVLSLTSAPLADVRASGLAVVSDHEDIAEARLEFQCGLVANLKASRISPAPVRQMKTFSAAGFAEIDFSTLTLQTLGPDASLLDRSFDLATATDNPLKFADELFADYLTPVATQVEPRNAILDELHDFVISIRSQTTPTVCGLAGARAVAVASMILQQISEKRWYGAEIVGQIGPHALPLEGVEAASRRVQQHRRSA